MTKDVELVLSIALSPTLSEDCLIWALTSSGKFTVKSVYKLALDERASHGVEESSNSSCMKEFWKFIWRLKVLNKFETSHGVHAGISYPRRPTFFVRR